MIVSLRFFELWNMMPLSTFLRLIIKWIYKYYCHVWSYIFFMLIIFYINHICVCVCVCVCVSCLDVLCFFILGVSSCLCPCCVPCLCSSPCFIGHEFHYSWKTSLLQISVTAFCYHCSYLRFLNFLCSNCLVTIGLIVCD